MVHNSSSSCSQLLSSLVGQGPCLIYTFHFGVASLPWTSNQTVYRLYQVHFAMTSIHELLLLFAVQPKESSVLHIISFQLPKCIGCFLIWFQHQRDCVVHCQTHKFFVFAYCLHLFVCQHLGVVLPLADRMESSGEWVIGEREEKKSDRREMICSYITVVGKEIGQKQHKWYEVKVEREAGCCVCVQCVCMLVSGHWQSHQKVTAQSKIKTVSQTSLVH